MVNEAALKVGPYTFEQVDDFKYLGININIKITFIRKSS